MTEVYVYPITKYMDVGQKLLPSAVDALGRLIHGDPFISGPGSLVVSRYLLLNGLITEKRTLGGGWRVEFEHLATDAGREFYDQHATWDC